MKKIEIGDKELFYKYTPNFIMNSEYLFTTLFAWADKYNFRYIIYKDFLIIFGTQQNGNMQCYFPLGEGDLKDCIQYIFTIFHENNKPFNMRPISKQMLEMVYPLISNGTIMGTKESYYDYIYNFNDLLYFEGKKYRKKRKQINSFYSNYLVKWELMLSSDIEMYLDALYEILRKSNNFDSDEFNAYNRILSHYDQLGVKGVAIRINGKIEGVAVGECCNDMIIMHIRRCNKKFNGIYPAILQLIMKEVFINSGCQIVNTQDDMGNLNIRYSKNSYKPKMLLKKYFIWEENNEMHLNN